jgi:hypothetical protein
MTIWTLLKTPPPERKESALPALQGNRSPITAKVGEPTHPETFVKDHFAPVPPRFDALPNSALPLTACTP